MEQLKLGKLITTKIDTATILRLSLEKRWFDMTKAGIKCEDYRELTPYWYSRLCTHNLQNKTQKWWAYYIENHFLFDYEFKKFDYNVMTLGYPSNKDTSRILKLEHKGIEIRTGNPDLGAEPNKLYFVIKHGRIIQ